MLDNGDGTVALPLSEISILRRLDRTGEGEYRLNGARCRLVDVLELLSDTGLGKETHSVISQGRVEAIVTSKPRDRRLLIEEAAGLGKHRKRRRRAQLKLERTEENLDRALDVEREARARLRPLKRQAEAAELHERLERQVLEARWSCCATTACAPREQLQRAEARGRAGAREACAAGRGRAAGGRRAARAPSRRSRSAPSATTQIAGSVFGARSARERLGLRVEQVAPARLERPRRAGRAPRRAQLELLRRPTPASRRATPRSPPARTRIAELERQLAELEEQRERELARELAALEGERRRAERERSSALAQRAAAARRRERRRARLASAREQLRDGRARARGGAARARAVGAELAAVNQFLRSHAARTAARTAPRR